MPSFAYEEAVAFWYRRINFERTTPTRNELKLDRMHRLLERIGNPHHQFPIIHVAGSKGKGSTSAFLATILEKAGYRTGLFTSPHLVDETERMQIDRQPIEHEQLAKLLNEVRAVVEHPTEPIEATFFEIGVALGFLFFARQHVDIAVVEVGLGGRLDSTNICQPILAVITSISYDHERILGPGLARIAGEKAGIIKESIPTVNGALEPEALQIIQSTCESRQSRLLQLGVDFHFRHQSAHISSSIWEPPQVQIQAGEKSYPSTTLGLLGEHQAENASIAVACVEELRRQGWNISEQDVLEGLATTRWPARLEVIQRSPLVLLDCAHNVASARALVETLRATFPHLYEGNRRRLLIFAVSHDKDLAGILRELLPHFTHLLLTDHPDHPRLLPPEAVTKVVRQVSELSTTVCASSSEAWRLAKEWAEEQDGICIAGSVFLAGELRPLLTAESLV